jgi:hypothetical protein
MNNIKERLRTYVSNWEIAPLPIQFEAADHIQILETANRNLHDHIAAQEKRIAELECVMRQITFQGGVGAVILATKALAGDIAAPSNAIDAERCSVIREAAIDAAQEWSDYVIEDTAPRTCAAHIEIAIDAAMKAAK